MAAPSRRNFLAEVRENGVSATQ